jgi:ubiquinone/menaquinone biosynthesis C-methylase UbiE
MASDLNHDWHEQVLEVKSPPEKVAGIYDRVAPLYEIWAQLTESRARRRVLELASSGPADEILEVATGTGVQLVSLARGNPHGHTVGVELSDGMRGRTRTRLRRARLDRVELLSADARHLPFSDASFDLLVNSYMLDLLPREDIPRVLGEFQRVLKPGGRLVLSNMTKGEARHHRIWDTLYAHGVVLTANCRGVLAAPVLNTLGFDEIKREYIAQMSFPTEIVTARKHSV